MRCFEECGIKVNNLALPESCFNMSKGVTFWKQAGLSYLQFLTISTRAVRSGLKVDVDYIDDGGLNSCQSLYKLTVMKYNVQYIVDDQKSNQLLIILLVLEILGAPSRISSLS